MRIPVAGVVMAVLALAACGNRTDQFPAGLEPLPDPDMAPSQSKPYTEALAMVSGDNGNYAWVDGRAYLLGAPGDVWAAIKNPDLEAQSCSTNSHTVTVEDDPNYELAFQTHYVVNNVLTIEWDEQWRFGTVDGTPADPQLAMVRYQKVFGSSFIMLIEGEIEVMPTDDPMVTELDLVEHVAAAGGTVDQLTSHMQFRFDSLVASLHGGTLPTCP